MLPKIYTNTRDILNIVKGIPADPFGAPGSQILMEGDSDRGIFGLTPVTEFADIVTGAGGTFNTSNILSITGVPGANEYGDTIPWLKFISNGTILYTPLKPLSSSVSWNQIYNAGCVYGTGDQGILPPNGRAGSEISITANNTVTNTSGDTADPGDGWLDPSATIGEVGDTVVMAGWADSANNGEFEITAIDDEEITLDTTALVNESANLDARVWNKADEVTQNQELELESGHKFKVRLLKGAEADPANYLSNRGQRSGTGDPVSEWVRLIMPLHERASDNSWNYSFHDNADLIDWSAVFYGGLTDADLITHQDHGSGSYTWTQEVRGDAQSYQRFYWARYGASSVTAGRPWYTGTGAGFSPVLQLIP